MVQKEEIFSLPWKHGFVSVVCITVTSRASHCDRCWINMRVRSPRHLTKRSKRKEMKQFVQDHKAKQSQKPAQTPWSCILLCLWKTFTEVIPSLQLHTFRHRHSSFPGSVNQRSISQLLRYSRWNPSAGSSLPIAPRPHPNLNTWNQSQVQSVFCSPRTPCSHHFTVSWGLAKSDFLWAMLSCKRLLWLLVTGASHCSLSLKRKQNFFLSVQFRRNWTTSSKVLGESEEGKGSADRACSICLLF